MRNTLITDLQWGDGGKGKIVDFLAPNFDYIVRFQGGDNSGHTVVVNGKRYALHLVPSGILYPKKTCVLGAGMAINPKTLLGELAQFDDVPHAKVIVSPKAAMVMPWHIAEDKVKGKGIGTTGKGMGPCYRDDVARIGLRIGDLLDTKDLKDKVESGFNRFFRETPLRSDELNLDRSDLDRIVADYLAYAEGLGDLICDVGSVLYRNATIGEGILLEGAQGTMLDKRFGTYPYVTSSDCAVGAVHTGTGVRIRNLEVLGLLKAYTTRVGDGPFPTGLITQSESKELEARLNRKKGEVGDSEPLEVLTDENLEGVRKGNKLSLAKYLRVKGNEYGTTTGRPRRTGWLDLAQLRYAARVNGVDSLIVTKLDILSGIGDIPVCMFYAGEEFPEDLEKAIPHYTDYEGWNRDISNVRRFHDLPENARRYCEGIQAGTGLFIKYIGVGPDREQIIGL